MCEFSSPFSFVIVHSFRKDQQPIKEKSLVTQIWANPHSLKTSILNFMLYHLIIILYVNIFFSFLFFSFFLSIYCQIDDAVDRDDVSADDVVAQHMRAPANQVSIQPCFKAISWSKVIYGDNSSSKQVEK